MLLSTNTHVFILMNKVMLLNENIDMSHKSWSYTLLVEASLPLHYDNKRDKRF